MDIIDEIEIARRPVILEGIEPNTIIIPESRREEIENFKPNWASSSFHTAEKKYVFGCEIIYSQETEKIKVGYVK